MPASESVQSDQEWADAISARLLREQDGFIEYPAGSNITPSQVSKAPTSVVRMPRPSVNPFRNGQAPVNRIPVELLTRVFALCALVDPISRTRPDIKVVFKPGWLNLTYVCSRWRKVALNYPALWASHATNEFGTRWMRTMLVRSKRVPVSLRVDLRRMLYVYDKDGRPINGWTGIEIEGSWPDHEDGEAHNEDDEPSDEDSEPADEDNEPSDEDSKTSVNDSGLIAKHLSHISHITFINLPGGLQKDQFDFLQRPAPMLESMRIDVPSYFSICSNFNPVVPTLSRYFLSSQAPQLRRLHLYEYLPSLNRPVSQTFSDLEHLHIASWSLRALKDGDDGVGRSNARSLIKWSQVLGLMKKLKTLSLKYCLPQYVDSASTNHAMFEFPDLQSLEVKDQVRDCGAFLQRLRIPAAAQVSIYCDTEEQYGTFGEAWSPVVSFVHAHLNAGTSPIQALSLIISGTTSVGGFSKFNAVVWRSPVAFPAASRPDGFTLALKLSFTSSFNNDEDDVPTTPTIHPFMQALDTPLLASVHTVQFGLHGAAAWNLMHVAPVVRCTPAVETLWVAGPDSGHAIAQVLQPQSKQCANAHLANTIPLPALKILSLSKVNLGANPEGREEDVNCVQLHACLKAREAVQGHRLKLRIRECAMKLKWWMALREVADVNWDGKDMDLQTQKVPLFFSGPPEVVPASAIS